MEFFNHIHCKYTGIKGFVKVYEDGLRYRYMIQEEALKRAKILIFWQKYGLDATKEAYGVSRATLYRWKRNLKQGQGRLESLNKKPTIPKRKRQRIVDIALKEFIIQQRTLYPRLGKEKLARILKEKGELSKYTKLSFYAKSGRLIERENQEKQGKN
jgi:transposase-like protein